MTDEERDIMNRLHAEGERRSNDFGHRTIADKTRRLASAHHNIQPTRRTCQKKAGRAGKIGESPQVRPPIRRSSPLAAPWLQVGFGRFDRLRLLDTALTLEPDESDHSGAVQLALRSSR